MAMLGREGARRVSDRGRTGEARVTVASRLSGYLRGGGILVPLITALLAFLVGGLLVALATGANPIDTYRAIFEGSGLNWLFPWVTGDDRTLAALNLQQTLILTTPLILTGLAVAFAFRAGLFNIGGQGQYLVGTFAAVCVGSSLDGTPALLHVVLAIARGAAPPARVWAGIAGLLKATTGANEVISTIMLNWIARLPRRLPVRPRRPAAQRRPAAAVDPGLRRRARRARGCRSSGATRSSRACTSASSSRSSWRRSFWVLLNRSVTGYEVRAVGFNPDAAEYGGISAGRNYVKVMLICGLFAGPGGRDRRARLAVPHRHERHPGLAGRLLRDRRRAARPQHGVRDRRSRRCCSARCSTARRCATSTRRSSTRSSPTNLTCIIQGLIVLFVSAPVLVTCCRPGGCGARLTGARGGGGAG